MGRLGWLCLGLLASVFTLDVACSLAADGWWFSGLGFASLYWTRVLTQVGLWLLFGGLTGLMLAGHLRLAQRWCGAETSVRSYPLKFGPFLALLVGISSFLTSLLLWQGYAIADLWGGADRAVLQGLAHLPQLEWNDLGRLLGAWDQLPGAWLWMVGGSLLVVVLGPQVDWAIALLVSLSMGFIASEHWTTVLAAFHPTPFGEVDPLFNLDIGFYIFVLPLWELLRFWWTQTALTAFLTVLLMYLRADNSLSEGKFAGFTPAQSRHLYGLMACVMVAIAFGFWLDRYALLYSTQGAIVGAGFADVKADLPAKTLLSLGALALTLLFWGRMLTPVPAKERIRTIPIVLGYATAVLVGSIGLPYLVQLTLVQPNELARERPYITQSIRLTRQAFDLDTIDVKTFNPSGNLTPQRLQVNDATIRNIRLWDTRPLLEANRQLQRIRPYYEFPDADIDRYTLQAPDAPSGSDRRQVLIAPRELDYTSVPEEAQTWVNKRLIYTHGYGFTVSPVNTAAKSGLPEYFVKDIGTDTDDASLRTATPAIQASVPTQNPRIYFGEMTTNYVMTDTTVPEFDYPQGDDNVYNTYDGAGGITIDSFGKRTLLAVYLRDWQMLLTQNFQPTTRVLFRRQIQQRIRAIAPFLRFDGDPYLVAAQVPPAPQVLSAATPPPSTLYWIIDAYTVSDRYPYSDAGNQTFNYIRNPVKVVIDAYNGTTTFYTINPEEPLLSTWRQVFPDLLQPLAAMPASLQAHLRYPIDYFQAQSESLLNYHMTDPQVFYNREDLWRIPNEIYGEEEQSVAPYYLIMKLPEGNTEEFVLLSPFTPARRNNLIAWLAARSDGQAYGTRLLYLFPKRELIFGPEQIEALINQDPVISQQISLWNRQGSRVLQGNLLIIPIEQSLLYVEPLYLEAEANRVPTLVQVVTVYRDRIVMAKTLEEALNSLFEPEQNAAGPIVRPVEEPVEP